MNVSTMNVPSIEVQIKYQRDSDAETGYLRFPAVPRVGECIIPRNKKRYKVVNVVYEENESGEVQPWIEVTPA